MIEAMKQMANYIDVLGGDSKKYRQAIAEAEKQEPVAWMDSHRNIYSLEEKAAGCEDAVIPLYTHPPKRKPLTDEQIKEAVLDDPFGGSALMSMMRDEVMVADVRQAIERIARAIETAHGIKGKA